MSTPPPNAQSIERYESRLLAREKYHRSNRHNAAGLAIFALIGLTVFVILRSNVGHPSGLDIFPIYICLFLLNAAIFGGIAMIAHAKVRHIESLRYHRIKDQYTHCPICTYDLTHLTEKGCPECGWARDVRCPHCDYDLTNAAEPGCPECGWRRKKAYDDELTNDGESSKK